MTLDPRLNAYRPDLADKRLQGKVEAARFVDGTLYRIAEPQAPLRRSPRHDAALETEALLGEQVRAFEIGGEGWAWCQLATDGYVGWLPASALGSAGAAATHKVVVPRTLGFPGPDIKRPPLAALPFGAQLTIVAQDERFAATDSGLYLPLRHVAPLAATEPDFVAVAERFVGVPYLWGGKTTLGIDCSGLVQIALQAAGLACPRDSDMQQRALGKPSSATALQRGDLVFWNGHVAIARDATMLIHANAYHMAVAIEPASEAIARIAAAGSAISRVKRL